ncbi:MAG: transposase [Acidobacteriaceae bacterium]
MVRLIAVKRKLTPQVGRETIRILLQSHELKPWRGESWCIADLNEEYIARMEDVLALYEKLLSDKEPVACVDEKPVVLHADVRPPRPMRPGRHFSKPSANRSSLEFADYLAGIAASYPEAGTIHLVMDNLSSHSRKALVDRFGENIGLLWNHFMVHYTPKHGRWLNQAEMRSACSPVNAWGGGESRRSDNCSGKHGR